MILQDEQALWRDAVQELDESAAMEVARAGCVRLGAFEYADTVMVPSLEKIGRDWEAGGCSLAEVYFAGKVSSRIIEELVPQSEGTARLAVCVLDDHHTLGKSLVLASLRTARLVTDDLGVVSLGEAVRLVEERGYAVLFVSTLMLRSALQVERLVAEIRRKGLPTAVIVGGAPFRIDSALAGRVCADAFGNSASEAVVLARQALGSGSS